MAYVPVLHAGYRKFFDAVIKEEGAEKLYLVGDDILAAHEELDYINRKDRLRAIPVEEMQKALSALYSVPVEILNKEAALQLSRGTTVLMPKEDLSELLVKTYFQGCINRTPFEIFLRWHRDNTAEEKAVEAHRTIDAADADREIMAEAFRLAEGSADWWRQVGSVIVKDGKVLFSGRNEHMPDEQSPYVHGDPRTVYKRGVEINLTTAAHGEGALIAEAAKAGISLAGASLYVTDFPCPYCARIIAHSGITKVYFSKGYAALDGEELLKGRGIELIYIDMKKEQE